MAFLFTIVVNEATDLELTLTDDAGAAFDFAAFLAAGGTATFRMVLDTGSMVSRVYVLADIENVAGDASNVATIHIDAGEVTTQGAYAATFTAGADVWTGTVTVAAPGTAATATAAGVTTLGVDTLLAYTLATRPTASVTWNRRFISVRDTGSDGETHYCRQKADGSYEWIVVAF